MITLEEALAVVDRVAGERRVAVEDRPVREAAGHVLSEPVCSSVALPPFNKSAMDGYAVMADDEREAYEVLEEVPAGAVPACALKPGTAVKVMTGAPVPAGAGRVIMVEDVVAEDGRIHVSRHDGKSNICRKGEDIDAGAEIMAAGTLLDAVGIANVLSCGVSSVRVYRRVRIAIVVTGDELVDDPADLGPGKIMDSNGPMLERLCMEAGLEVGTRVRIWDDLSALTAGVTTAAEACDILLLTGGVSAGDYDFVPDALRAAGFTLCFDRVAMKPGKPLTFATHTDCLAFGLPGNPVSVYTAFHLFVRRAAARLAGAEPPVRVVAMPLARTIKQKGGDRLSLTPCRLTPEGTMALVDYHGSAHLLGLQAADGLCAIPVGKGELPAGTNVDVYVIRLCT